MVISFFYLAFAGNLGDDEYNANRPIRGS